MTDLAMTAVVAARIDAFESFRQFGGLLLHRRSVTSRTGSAGCARMITRKPGTNPGDGHPWAGRTGPHQIIDAADGLLGLLR